MIVSTVNAAGLMPRIVACIEVRPVEEGGALVGRNGDDAATQSR